ncbi:MAG: EVE domain-containing protein [Bdellovibrionota bacterium]
MTPRYWLMKSEPDVFSIFDLEKSPKKTTGWEGVRNYQARNFLRDDIKKGDGVLFYHSRTKPMAVVGTAKVVKDGYPDPLQFEPSSPYFDPQSSKDNPRWYAVDIQLEEIFSTPVTLHDIKQTPSLDDMPLVQKGMRLSVQPVKSKQWTIIVKKGKHEA